MRHRDKERGGRWGERGGRGGVRHKERERGGRWGERGEGE